MDGDNNSTGKKKSNKAKKDGNNDDKKEDKDPKDDKDKCSENSQVQLGPYSWYTFIGEKYEEAIELFLASQLGQGKKEGPLPLSQSMKFMAW